MRARTRTRNVASSSTLGENVDKLPHERDETPEAGIAPSERIEQAESDLRHGQVDTDNYSRAREVMGRADRARDRRR